jgi:hypothetical protein
MNVEDPQDSDDERLVREKIKRALLEIVDSKQIGYLEWTVHNLINLVRRNKELSDDLLQNLILRQIFNTCDKSKVRQTPLVSKRILNLLRTYA